MIRVIFDTNVWISYLLSDKLKFIDGLIQSDQITLLFSDDLIREIIEVSLRKKFEALIKQHELLQLVEAIQIIGEIVQVQSNTEISRDPDDNFLLALAKDGNAHYLVTGDKDLLVLERFENTQITTIAHFKTLIGTL